MAIDRSYIARNDAQRRRLRALVDRLTDEDLRRPVAAGWTVAATLAHLAFWDQRTVVLLDAWKGKAPTAVPGDFDDAMIDWINDATKPLCLALAPREAARLAVAIADEADRAVAALPDDLVRASTERRTGVYVLRAEHRQEHLDEIERTLGAC
jgi:Mycothiol maleylpyruvate isomerase N-terminal domain